MIREVFDAADVRFTSDTHYGHESIIGFCDRPFKTIGRHDTALHKLAWDEVGSDKIFIHLGDFTFERDGRAQKLVDLMPGAMKILVAGNHDADFLTDYEGWDLVVPYLELTLRRPRGKLTELVVCHYPFQVWNGSQKGALHLHGHSHGRLPAKHIEGGGARIDVGVDNWDYRPVSLEQIEERVNRIRAVEDDGRAPWAVEAGQFEWR